MEIKVKKGKLADERFRMLMNKLIGIQTTGENAYHINKVYKEITRHGDEYGKTFNGFKNTYAVRNADNSIALGKDQDGHEVPDTWMPMEDKKAELDDVVKKLNEEMVILKCRPLTPKVLGDTKVSAYEIELLGDLYSPENGPGVPLHAV